MLSVHDIVSWLEREEEIKIFGERFFRPCPNEDIPENIIGEDDGFSFSVISSEFLVLDF